MDPLVARVAARYAARTIQFDSRKVSMLGSTLAEQAVQKLLRALPASSPVGKVLGAKETIVSDKIQLRNVQGKDVVISVRVGHRPMRNNRPTAGGHYEPSSKTITMYLNSNWPPELLDSEKNQIMTTFSTFLVHEMTHALDVIREEGYVGAEGDPDVYYNQPSEFRAYVKQIVTDVLTRFKMVMRKKYRGKPFPSLSKLVEDLLEVSPNYEKVKDHFNARSHKRLRQIMVRELQDSGLLT